MISMPLLQCLTLVTLMGASVQNSDGTTFPTLASPITKDGWIFPASDQDSEPVFGIEDGISVGLWPTPGPRGLLRIFTPYLGQPPGQVINFIAIEPLVQGRRSFSELEDSASDQHPGKLMWISESPDGGETHLPWRPAAPDFFEIEGNRAMKFWVLMEPFASGACPVLQVILRQDHPHEATFQVFATEGSTPMQACILSATMGNYERLRRLWLKERVVEAKDLWPEFHVLAPHGPGFAPHREWPVQELVTHGGDVVVAATPSERDPSQAVYTEQVPFWFRYQGQWATQYWKTPVGPNVVARVNGRVCYWGSRAEIPGGIAFENFELEAPFSPGQSFTFGATPELAKWMMKAE